jgi:hypothetical protein
MFLDEFITVFYIFQLQSFIASNETRSWVLSVSGDPAEIGTAPFRAQVQSVTATQTRSCTVHEQPRALPN